MKKLGQRTILGALTAPILVAAACSSDDVPVTPPSSTPDAGEEGGAGDASMPVEASCTPSSGTRLKLKWLVGPDGARVLAGMYDTTLASPCAFFPTSDGKTWRLPFTGTKTVKYLDSGCQQAVMQKYDSDFAACDCTQPLFLIAKNEGCVAGYPSPGAVAYAETCEPRTVRVGAPWPGPKYQKFGNDCSSVEFPGRVFFEGIDDVDQTQYATVNVVIE